MKLFNALVSFMLETHSDYDTDLQSLSSLRVLTKHVLLFYMKIMFSEQSEYTRNSFFEWLKVALQSIFTKSTKLLESKLEQKSVTELEKVILTRILPFFVLSMATSLDNSNLSTEQTYTLCNELRTHLLPFLRVLDERNAEFYNVNMVAEHRCTSLDYTAEHSDASRVVQFPGTDHLLLYFGYSCNLETGMALEIYSDTQCSATSMIASLSTNQWPHSMTVQGDTVAFRLQGGTASSKGRIQVVVLGQIHWILELESTIAHLLSKCAAVLIAGPPLTPTEMDNKKFMDSVLLHEGLDDGYYKSLRASFSESSELNEDDNFLEDFLYAKEKTPGGALYAFLLSNVIRGIPIGKTGGPQVDAAQR
jgi:hypothetical protein